MKIIVKNKKSPEIEKENYMNDLQDCTLSLNSVIKRAFEIIENSKYSGEGSSEISAEEYKMRRVEFYMMWGDNDAVKSKG